jgi:hypothetical protein
MNIVEDNQKWLLGLAVLSWPLGETGEVFLAQGKKKEIGAPC